LANKPWLRLATEADYREARREWTEADVQSELQSAREIWGTNWHPYYAVGDFNRDGQEDFAVGLINKRERVKRLAYSVFNAPFDTNTPAFFREGFDLWHWFFYNPGVMDRNLMIGVYETDGGWLFAPRGKGYVLE
jgi:hypothetical protein